MKHIIILLLFCTSILYSQDYFPTYTGVKTSKNTTVALTNATIYATPTKKIDKGTLVIKNGKVIAVGTNASTAIPKGAVTVNLQGKTIYPSFIDVYSTFGIAKPQRPKTSKRTPQYDAERKGYYWNDHIRPDTDAFSRFSFDTKKAKELLKAGFGVVSTHLEDGIMQGNGLLVALDSSSSNAYRILDKQSANYLSFNKSIQSRQVYPTSRMGAMALLRQAYLDAAWYAKGNAQNTDFALQALNDKSNLPHIFNAGDYLNVLRADKVGDEFNIQYTILGGGDEYKRIDAVKQTNATLIIPIDFKKAYDVSNLHLAEQISLSDMRAWNQEPTNPSVLSKNGVPFALTTHGLKSTKTFHKNLQKAIKYGLDKIKALESLTTIPAQILRNSKIGNLKKGSYANFLVTSGDVFEAETVLYENWTLGTKNIINSTEKSSLLGEYVLNLKGKSYDLTLSGNETSQKSSLTLQNQKIKSSVSFFGNQIYLTINENDHFTRLTATVDNAKKLQGTAVDSFGNRSDWSATRKTDSVKKQKITDKPSHLEVMPVTYPNMAYGNLNKPQAETILIKDATIWTSEDANQVLKNTDLLIKNGKIDKIGKNLSASGAKIIKATGKYVTAGIIDEHSHIATSAVNEAGHNSSAEVSIEDVIQPDDISIYRSLTGGVTSIQILHGSANPIGGRSAIIKLKWGEEPDKLIYKNTPKFIKFALGENVKQSNWGDFNTIRFPQTRMGVEQVYTDYFQRAKEYGKAKQSGTYRKDIELETLLEILKGERFISCHSYVQSEINMLMKVAEKFGFTVNTFTHILEGYKVADKMKQHGAGGSTFSDWWAYKYEVNDAIPYNAAILQSQGIVTAINSDDAEMIRRLNQEAAKTIKYGNVSEQEAWKMVTINPAKLLHINNRTGSLKVGKDADVVIWNGNPLSVYSKVLTTIIDGAIYYDAQKDQQKRAEIKAEKAKLIDMMLQEKLNGAKTQAPKKKIKKHFHCDTI